MSDSDRLFLGGKGAKKGPKKGTKKGSKKH